jgi:hypothetical protein
MAQIGAGGRFGVLGPAAAKTFAFSFGVLTAIDRFRSRNFDL